MKKVLLPVLLIALSVPVWFFFSSSKPIEVSPPTTKEKITLLEKLNLIQSKEYLSIPNYDEIMNTSLVERYKKDFGLKYLSQKGLEIFMAQNNLITASPNQYTGDLDLDAAIVLKNSEKITKEWEVFRKEEKERLDKEAKDNREDEMSGLISDGSGGGIITWSSGIIVLGGPPPDAEMFIVAPTSKIKLNPGQTVQPNGFVTTTPRDPLLIIKVKEGGYAVLAQWY